MPRTAHELRIAELEGLVRILLVTASEDAQKYAAAVLAEDWRLADQPEYSLTDSLPPLPDFPSLGHRLRAEGTTGEIMSRTSAATTIAAHDGGL